MKKVDSTLSEDDVKKIEKLKNLYRASFNHLSIDEERTIEFYYKSGLARGVDSYLYVEEAIKRTKIKGKVNKPISYLANLIKNFYRRGLYAQASQEENDIIFYIEGRIGNISKDNIKLLQSAISTNGATRVMAAAAEILNNSKVQDEIIEKIILRVVDIFGELKPNN